MVEGSRCVGLFGGFGSRSRAWSLAEPVSYVGTGFSPLTDEEKTDRLIAAVLNSIDTWIQEVVEIESAAIPFTGNKARALHLQRSMLSAKQTLRRLADLPEED